MCKYSSAQGQPGPHQVRPGRIPLPPGRRPAVRPRLLLVRHHGVDQAAARPGVDAGHQRRVQQDPHRLPGERWVKRTRKYFLFYCFLPNFHSEKIRAEDCQSVILILFPHGLGNKTPPQPQIHTNTYTHTTTNATLIMCRNKERTLSPPTPTTAAGLHSRL